MPEKRGPVMTQLKLFSELNLPIAVRPHRLVNFEQAKWARIAAELAAVRREHAGEQLPPEASDRLLRQIDEVEREIVAELRLIERDCNAYIERMLVKIRGEL
jgi:hypothetical protein